VSDWTGLRKIGVHVISVEPGRDSTEFHFHHHEEECLYVLEGEAEARIGDEVTILRPGDFVGYRAQGKPHSLRNIGTGSLKYLVVGQRLDHDVCDYPEAGKRLYLQAGLPPTVVDLADLEVVPHL